MTKIPILAALLLLMVSCFFTQRVQAQDTDTRKKVTLSGYIKDSESGETLIGATVYIADLKVGAAANVYGFYSLSVEPGTYIVTYSFLGYKTIEQEVELTGDNVRVNLEMSSSAITTEEIVITGERKDKNVESTDMGKIELSTEQIKSIPVLFGEVDILKTLQLLPGVQSAGEGNSGFYVRGGGPDQNLILLDNAVVYNTGHLFGFFSVFNSDAIKSTTLYKGGMPAQYGGRLSSVVDIQMKEGNMKKYQVEGGIGLISSRLTIQGPIKKDKASFIVSARRTYIDLIMRPILKRIQDGDLAGNSYYFYDLNAKINYKFSDKDRLFASGYFGRDVFNFRDPDGAFKIDIPWGNATATMRWNHLFSDRLFMNLTAIFNDYDFGVSSGFEDLDFELFSGVRDWGGKLDFDYFPNAKHNIKFGLLYTFHKFSPYNAEGTSGEIEVNTDDLINKFAHETALYIQDDWKISERVKVNFGLRASMFNHVGPLERKVFDDQGRITDTLRFGKSEGIATYGGVEPRVSARIKLTETASLKAGITMNNQYIHLVSSSTTTLPTDLWVPSTQKVKPQLGIQYAIGYFHNHKDNMYETSLEVYYKDMRNQIEFAEGFQADLNVDIEEGFTFGRGHSTGAEFFVKKTRGKFQGWVGYTLSYTWRKFDELNSGERFPAKYDRRHDLSVVGIYNINEKWKVSAVFVYGTGQATTVPVGRYFIEGEVVNIYGERNSYRLAPYHRLDLAATYVMTKRKHYSDLTFSIYNLYNRANPYFIFYDIDGSVAGNDLSVEAKQASLFPILPSITWNFKF